jgi:hypothetical protein
MSYWDIYLENSLGTWDDDGTIPRPNDDLQTELTSTQQKIRLADGSNAFIQPEIKRVKEPITMFWADTSSSLRSKIETYMLNGDKVKIVTHTAEEFIGRFVGLKRVWFSGIDDSYDIQVNFERTE